MYLYIHGFNSSSQSGKAQELKRWLEAQGRGDEWLCPDLPGDPEAAMRVLENIVICYDDDLKLVGSSLGGFYATVLAAKYPLKAVVINPAVYASLVLRPALGIQKGWHDEQSWEFTQTHLQALQAMDLLKPANPDNIFLLQETGDEVLDWQIAQHFYRDCHQLIFRGGNHGFTRFQQVIDLIDRF